jgi:catalase
VPSDEHALTIGPASPVLLHDYYLNEKLAHFVRERVPDRVYRVKGGGAFGYFEVTAEVSQWTKTAFLSQGVERFVQERAVNEYWAKVDHDLGARIASDLGLPTPPR